MVSMKRPSRGARESATTMRYVGCFLLPLRVSLIAVAICHLLFVTLEYPRMVDAAASHAQHLERVLRHLARPQLLHHLLHLLELVQQLVHGLYVVARATRDAATPAPVDRVGVPPLLDCHGVNDSLNPVEGGVVHLQ